MKLLAYSNGENEMKGAHNKVGWFFLKAKSWKLTAGLSLIEMLVSVTLFSTIMIVAVGALLSIVEGNRKAQSYRTVVDSFDFALENIVRNIRLGSGYSTSGSSCGGGAGWTEISFTSFDGRGFTYRLSRESIERTIRSGAGSETLSLTPPGVPVSRLCFFFQDASRFQPRVRILVGGSFQESAKTRVTFDLETLVTQRKIDS